MERSPAYYIETVGCQMNTLDTELLSSGLASAGYEQSADMRKADIILFVTCSVRAHAEDKIYSALGRLKNIKKHRPDTIIGVLGCMAQKEGEKIFRRAPHVDLVAGPGRLGHVTDWIGRIIAGEGPILDISKQRTNSKIDVLDSFEPFDPHRESDPHLDITPSEATVQTASAVPYQAMVRAMFGCDNFCSYCIVPSVRGPEQCRPWPRIVEEVRSLVDRGCVEVTLIGQTVNNYQSEAEGRTVRLPELLEMLDGISGLHRLKFVTSHPKYMSDSLIRAVADLPSCIPFFHVPAQSGSDRVLKQMNRKYTIAEYDEMLAKIYEWVPDAAVTSDFIVGFCGETDEDFEQTVELVRRARFKNSFIFKYSTREGTTAHTRFEDDVPYPVKQERNNRLLAVQNEISLADNLALKGRTVEILVEGPSKVTRRRMKHATDESPAKSDEIQLVGRTVHDRIVVFDGTPDLIGKILPVKIEHVEAFTLTGRFDPVASG